MPHPHKEPPTSQNLSGRGDNGRDVLLKAGVPVKVVSERLGHAKPAFTIETYQHVLPGMQAQAALVFENLVGPSTGPSTAHR